MQPRFKQIQSAAAVAACLLTVCIVSCWLLDFVLPCGATCSFAVQTMQLLRWIESQPDTFFTTVLCNIFSCDIMTLLSNEFMMTYCDFGIHHRLNTHIPNHSQKLCLHLASRLI